MGRVIGREENDIEKLPEELRRPGQVDVVDGVAGFGRGHHVGFGTDAADPGRDPGHLLDGPPDAEFFEAAQLRHLEEGVGDVAGVVEEDRDLAVTLQPGDGIEGDRFHFRRLPTSELARPNR